jgi:catechol 2,3-dioxygenase-like lactoylglutathione lyase family enzyme
MFKTTMLRTRSVVGMSPTFDAIGLAVADMATSLKFYRRLGLDIPAGSDHGPHAEASLPGGVRLMFDAQPDSAGPKSGPSMAFLCEHANEVDSVYTDLADAGYVTKQAPWDAEWGQRYAIVQDPDGYQIELFAWLKPQT